MKKLGLIGGISWITTTDYYKYINEGINERLGGLNYAQCIIHSFSIGDIKKLMDAEDFNAVLALFTGACMQMKQGGVSGIVLCANTMHMFADDLQQRTGLPVIHMVTAKAKAIANKKLTTVALLGTRITMDKDFYKQKLAEHGIKTIVPGETDKDFIHASIFDELSRGVFTETTQAHYLSIIDDMIQKGAEGIVLACTDIPPLLNNVKTSVPLFDTTRIHAEAAVDFCLS